MNDPSPTITNATTTTNTIFTPENSSNKELGSTIRNEIENLANQFMSFDDKEREIKRNKKSLILEMADKFERLRELGEFPFPVYRICSAVYYYLQRKGYQVHQDYVYEILRTNAPQYINSSTTTTNSSSSPSYESSGYHSIDIKIQQNKFLEAADTIHQIKPSILKRDQIQDLLPKLYEAIDIIEDFADTNNITTIPSGTVVEPHYDSEDVDPFRDTITTEKPDPRQTPSTLGLATIELGESIAECGKTIIATGKMILDYPPDENDKEMEINAVKRVNEWKQFWDLLSKGLKGGTDRKYRRSIVQWVKIAEDEDTYGKHAASSKNPYVARLRDPKTGEWKEEVRKLTREAIGDKAPKVREFASLFKKSVPACLDFIIWSEKYLHQYTNSLSVRLHDKLSDRSLR